MIRVQLYLSIYLGCSVTHPVRVRKFKFDQFVTVAQKGTDVVTYFVMAMIGTRWFRSSGLLRLGKRPIESNPVSLGDDPDARR